MKKTVLFFFFTFLLMMGTAIAQQDIPNSGLNEWEQLADTNHRDPVHWSTPNGYISFIDVTVERSGEAYEGPYCAELTSKRITVGQVFYVPGVITLGTFEIDMGHMEGKITGGIPFTSRPNKLKGWYKNIPADLDSCMFLVLLTKWDEDEMKRDTIGSGVYYQADTIEEWTEFEVEIAGEGTPDSMNVIISSSASLMQPWPDSKLFVDALSLEYPAGIEHDLMPEVNVSVYPNPASEYVYFTIPEKLHDGKLSIFNVKGELVHQMDYDNTREVLHVAEFAAGTYHFYLMERNRRVSSGSFMID
ncbi:MAG: PCMD domain-containing protein [Bacteroidales bacterium]|nr:PCMD domain-containing protein [Bacteroidales bacterium]MCF8343067.1 PCMD domain-containing protein [Bacteroidales bacterium]MCF8349810.1 PCMD domain-containing protein [Bacteroidales bacterium]MCF8375930.1 PCMD domain-containing protein [Bacteroidales bacterium]